MPGLSSPLSLSFLLVFSPPPLSEEIKRSCPATCDRAQFLQPHLASRAVLGRPGFALPAQQHLASFLVRGLCEPIIARASTTMLPLVGVALLLSEPLDWGGERREAVLLRSKLPGWRRVRSFVGSPLFGGKAFRM